MFHPTRGPNPQSHDGAPPYSLGMIMLVRNAVYEASSSRPIILSRGFWIAGNDLIYQTALHYAANVTGASTY